MKNKRKKINTYCCVTVCEYSLLTVNNVIILVSVLFLILSSCMIHPVYASHTFLECSDIKEESIRQELNKICQNVFSHESKLISLDKIVENEWTLLSIDDVINHNVDNAVNKIKSEYGYLDRMLSAWSPDKSKELAQKAAQYTFKSENFKSHLDKLSVEVAAKISQKLDYISAKSATESFMCIEEFIGNKYPDLVTSVFEEEIKKETDYVEFNTNISNIPTVSMHKKGLGGISVIIGSHIAKKLTKRITKKISARIVNRIIIRVLGRIGSSAIPVVGWIVGGGMIIWDVVTSTDGALPHIQESLKSENIKNKIKEEITLVVAEQLPLIIPQIAREIADDVFRIWSDFKRKFRAALELSNEIPEFKIIMQETATEDFYKLANLTNIINRKIGKQELINSIKSGNFRYMMDLPENSFKILQTTKSIDSLIDWAELAKHHLDEVVDFEIYKHKSPGDFNEELLEKLVSINDKKAISELVLLENNLLEAMLILSPDNLKKLSTHINSEDMKHLAWYILRLDESSRNEIVFHLIDNPFLIGKLKNTNIKKYIIKSKNKTEVIRFLLSENGFFDFLRDINRLFSRNITSELFFYKYWNLNTTTLFIVLLAVVLLLVTLYKRKGKKLNVDKNVT